jgi:NitT/TauT family transport system substrate-binding protein
MSRMTWMGGFVVALAMLSTQQSADADDLVKIAVPQQGAWDTGLSELAKRGGIFKKHGLDVEILYTQAGPESIQALIAGSVDIATGVGVTAAVGTISKGAPIRIIGNEILGAPDQYWYVPADSAIRKIDDFNDKTLSFSLPGSSSNAAALALTAQYKLRTKLVSTGSIASTLTQTLTKQVDIGFSAVPFFLDKVEAGEIRIVATGEDVAMLKTRTGRVNLSNLNTLQNRKDVLVRFHRAYKETIEWMYSDPAALKHFAAFSRLPESVVNKVRTLIPKDAMQPDKIVGIEQIISEALQGKFITAPLTIDQVNQMIQIQAN